MTDAEVRMKIETLRECLSMARGSPYPDMAALIKSLEMRISVLSQLLPKDTA